MLEIEPPSNHCLLPSRNTREPKGLENFETTLPPYNFYVFVIADHSNTSVADVSWAGTSAQRCCNGEALRPVQEASPTQSNTCIE